MALASDVVVFTFWLCACKFRFWQREGLLFCCFQEESGFLSAVVLLERRRARGLPRVVASTVWVARLTFLGLRTTGVLTLTGVTALSSVVDTPLKGGVEGRAELVTFVLLHGATQNLAHGFSPPCMCTNLKQNSSLLAILSMGSPLLWSLLHATRCWRLS